MPPPALTELEAERLTLLTAPAPHVPACDALSPRFPRLAYFVRMLAVLLPQFDEVEELLTLYTMGWHCAPHERVRDCADTWARFAAGELDEDTAEQLTDFSARFMLFYLRCPRLQARFQRLSCCPRTVVLPV